MSKLTTSKLEFDPSFEARRISKFIKDYVSKSGTTGVAIGISGGIDSAVSAFLAVRALGRTKVQGLLLFEDSSRDSPDYNDARAIIAKLKIKSADVSISPAFNAFKKSLQRIGFRASKFTLGNVKARCRMVILYSFANENNLLVLGTGDRSEEEIGYFTKYGDGGVDLQPIAHLYKTQVRILGKELGVPHEVIDKPSSPHLWRGHQATDEIPVDYPTLDRILTLLYDKSANSQIVARKLGLRTNVVNDVIFLHDKSSHKRNFPPSLIEIG